jgi:integrase/recombinase XerD
MGYLMLNLNLISGHASKKSLAVYQHLSLETVKNAYQAAVRGLESEQNFK